jgi:methylenetetrahydrofolate dehydrogenase (NADP+)/methenyltetrahydrofolate cyclohydrolase
MGIKIDGKRHAAELRAAVKASVSGLAQAPSLAVVLVGEDPGSLAYIKGKEAAANEVGIRFELHALPEAATQDEVLELLDKLNSDKSVNGVIVQQPLPKHIDKNTIVNAVAPIKDVDCLHPFNVGKVLTGQDGVLPCTPAGVVYMLKNEGIIMEGKSCVIIGRSDIVGKPLALLMLRENATVTVCHSRTANLPEVCRQADILVAALGKARFVTADMIKEGAVVVDVGINRLSGKKICGDVDYADCFEKASYITPVPGGVGPMTVAYLMDNCVKAWKMQNE